MEDSKLVSNEASYLLELNGSLIAKLIEIGVLELQDAVDIEARVSHAMASGNA